LIDLLEERPFTFRPEDFSSFHYMYIMKINGPRGGANFDPRVIIWTFLVEVYHTMFHAKYLTCSLFRFSEEDFFMFYNIHRMKNLWSPRAVPILILGSKFDQLWYWTFRWYHRPNIKALGHFLSDQKIFQVFTICM
jgi:hypothetical protein